MKRFKNCPAMMWCGESPQTSLWSVRASKAGFFIYTLKSKEMKEELNPSQSHVRQLTVSYLYQSGKFNIPFIRLCGKWLKDAGFFPSAQISVKVEKRKLVIEMVEGN